MKRMGYGLGLAAIVLCGTLARADEPAGAGDFRVTPAATGLQLVRASIPLPPGFPREGDGAIVRAPGERPVSAGLRIISTHPTEPPSARRALVTFPWVFADRSAVTFRLEPDPASVRQAPGLREAISLDGELIRLAWPGREPVELTLVAPPRTLTEPPRVEVIEQNPAYRWRRWHFADPQWPRIVEVREDVTGGIVVVAHLQRADAGENVAPELGWDLATSAEAVRLETNDAAADGQIAHSFVDGTPAKLVLDEALAVEHPTAPLTRRGGIEAVADDDGRWTYRYRRCRAEDRVPMQPMAWRRCEIVLRPPATAGVTAALGSPHAVAIEPGAWAAAYPHLSPAADVPPELEALVAYHRDAVVRCMAVGDDLGSITSFSDEAPHGGTFGMNRLNHAAPIFDDAWRSNDRRLLEAAILWADNFFDQSIWWGDPQRGGTRYNNVAAQNRTPPTTDYMWRSDDSVSFCTKGYDAFWLAWEETGDPQFREAFEAQVAYAAGHLHAHADTCRNIGDVRDFVRLHRWTGEPEYLEEALRLFRELRTCLSDAKLFDEGGKPIDPAPPFIEDDTRGSKIGYAKPYIIGYALAGLPELLPLAPDEPDLEATVRAVADFLADSVDPSGGWRYPHPRSSAAFVIQGVEHAWQITQACRALGPEPQWLDAIETVLRPRILLWQKTGRLFAGLDGWETSTGQVQTRGELNDLYHAPDDRDPTRDYAEGRLAFGSAPPEGLVYFNDVLAYYLQHRPIERLLEPPAPDEPLGQILERAPAK